MIAPESPTWTYRGMNTNLTPENSDEEDVNVDDWRGLEKSNDEDNESEAIKPSGEVNPDTRVLDFSCFLDLYTNKCLHFLVVGTDL